MPRFFFDIDDGLSNVTDTHGVELDNAQNAYGEAKRSLLELVAEARPSVGQRSLKCRVRCDRGASVYLLNLTTEEAFGMDANAGWEKPKPPATDTPH